MLQKRLSFKKIINIEIIIDQSLIVINSGHINIAVF